MELREYLFVVNKYKWLVVGISLVATLAAFFLSYFKPVVYDASLSFAVNRTNREVTDQYQYDGYYAIQASDLVSQTLLSWFATPSVVEEIYTKANIKPNFNSLNEYATLFSTKKYSGQNIGVKFTEKERSVAEKVAQSTVSVISEKVLDLNKSADAKALFEAVPSPVVIVENKPNVLLNTLIGLSVGLILGLFLAYLVYYFQAGQKGTI